MSVPSSENPQGATLGDFTIKGHKQPGLYGEVSYGSLTNPDDAEVKSRWPEIGHSDVAIKKLKQGITEDVRKSEIRAVSLVQREGVLNENFLIPSKEVNEAILGDFGLLTKLEDGAEQAKDLQGTAEYYAPRWLCSLSQTQDIVHTATLQSLLVNSSVLRLDIEGVVRHPWITGQKTDNIIPNPPVVTCQGSSASTSGRVLPTRKTSVSSQTGPKGGKSTSNTPQNKTQGQTHKTRTPTNPGSPARTNITPRPESTTNASQPNTRASTSRPTTLVCTTRTPATQPPRVRSKSPSNKKRRSLLSCFGCVSNEK
ncbi:hypothetical protein PNOK_0753900 [Pyrrhoderma noxium]|uniref:Uncharacterized protein n=1 Tax=Pyrrhoderma noxium TaxID=2282107 RepID=A0A286UDA8_9AGAM|nr:hypothetical protein PNOK_0753900 [Pyrrhoderma noxium]